MCLLTMTATILFFGKPLGRLIHSVTVPSGSGDISLSTCSSGAGTIFSTGWSGLVCDPTFHSWGYGGCKPAGSGAEHRRQTHFVNNLLKINLTFWVVTLTPPCRAPDLQYIGDRYRIGQCEESRRRCGNVDVGT